MHHFGAFFWGEAFPFHTMELSVIDHDILPGIEALLSSADLPAKTSVEVRRIGTSDEMVGLIIDRIVIGEKTMTYTLPWLRTRECLPPSKAGDCIVALNGAGQPELLLRLTRVKNMLFGEMTEQDIAEEGKPLRSLEKWQPLHIEVWNEKLAPHKLTVSDSMPVTAEYFKVLSRA